MIVDFSIEEKFWRSVEAGISIGPEIRELMPNKNVQS